MKCPKNPVDYGRFEERRVLASFTGTADIDIIQIQYESGAPTSITINGDQFANADPTMVLILPENSEPDSIDQISLVGDEFQISLNQVDRETEVNVNAASLMISAESGLSLATGQGHDSVDLAFSTMSNSFDPFDFGRPVDLDLAGGSDRITVDGPFNGQWNLGAGNDHFFSKVSDSLRGLEIDLGDGFDHWNISESLRRVSLLTRNGGGVVLGEPSEPFVGPSYRIEGVEVVDALSANDPIFQSKEGLYEAADGSETWRIDVTGDSAYFSDQASGDSLILKGFGIFQGDQDPIGADDPEPAGTLAIHETATDIRASYFERVVVGGNLSAGNTSAINHEINVRSSAAVSISNSGNGTGQHVFVDHQSDTNTSGLVIRGLTDMPVVVDRYEGQQSINLMGSNSARDIFTVAANNRNVRLSLFGNGGDDVFRVGTKFGVHQEANLDRIRGIVNVVDGAGNDFLLVNDSQATAAFSYRIRDNWVHNSPDPAGQANREFVGVWHSQIERVRVDGSTASNRFRVTPSLKTAMSIFGGESGNDEDILFLLPPYSKPPTLVPLGQDTGAFWFGNDVDDEKLVYFQQIELARVV